MKIAVTLLENSSDSVFENRFGRAAYFGIVDTQTNQVEIISNQAKNENSGAGVMAANTLIDRGVQEVVSGRFGPKAFQIFRAAKINMLVCKTEQEKNLPEVLKLYLADELEKIDSPN